MSVNNISSIYTRLLSNLKEKNGEATAASTDKSKSTAGTGSATTTGKSSTTGNTKADSVKLGTDTLDAEEYLNYGQLAKYTQPSLLGFLSESEYGGSSTNLFGTDSNSEYDSGSNMDLNSIMNGGNSSESDSGMFDALIQSATLHNNQMINQAVKKYASANSTNADDFAKKVEAIKAEIKADIEKATGKTSAVLTLADTNTSSTTKTK